MTPLLFLLADLFRRVLARLRAPRSRTDAGEIVTWVILAAALAAITLAVATIIGAKLRSTAEGIELE
jgi:hypothetical protein